MNKPKSIISEIKLLKLGFIILATLFAITSQAHSYTVFMDGNRLLEYCESTNNADQNRCRGYIIAIVDSVATYNSTPIGAQGACVPNGVTDIQVRDVVIRYLRKYPHIRNQPASDQVYLALSEVWKRCY